MVRDCGDTKARSERGSLKLELIYVTEVAFQSDRALKNLNKSVEKYSVRSRLIAL